MGTPLPSSKRGGALPQFSAHVYYGQTAGWVKMVLGMEVSLGPGDFVIDGDPASPPQKGDRATLPNFLAHFYCGQTAGCTEMPLGTELGLSPGDFVLDGDPALPLPKKRAERPPNFRPMFIMPNGWMDQDGTWYGDRPQPSRLCVRWGPSPLSKKWQSPTNLGRRILWPNGCTDHDATWYGGRPRPA